MLKYNLQFADLYTATGLQQLDKHFCQWLYALDIELYHRLMGARAQHLAASDESKLLVELAPFVELFIADFFAITEELQATVVKHNELAPLFTCKRLFVQRKVGKNFALEELAALPVAMASLQAWGIDLDDELSFAKHVMQWMQLAETEKLDAARIYAGWALFDAAGKAKHAAGVLFKLPIKTDCQNLIHLQQEDGKFAAEITHPRTGFNIDMQQFNLAQALDNANYCIFCHNQGKDSCAHGSRDKISGEFQVNELRVQQTGCPLEEHISEMNYLKSQAVVIGALAVAMVANPLLAATGHRICNDCMKACIYQKQEPVDIPMVESQTLQDVLLLPWGFEIYSLLTRWNPLNFAQPLPLPEKRQKILVVGLGPAGFTLAHYLLQQGYIVVAIDGLKIEPLPAHISGIDAVGERHAFEPIKDINTLYEPDGQHAAYGFGGVAEYGITVRWNKNYLKIIRLLLERRANFRMYGGVRFGSNITYANAKQLGFDHIALAVGAGSPNLPHIPNILAKGVRTASDFLMSLQLTEAAKFDSLANLQIRLPVVVIGGGLTAVDAATESLAYYPVQVEKFLQRYEQLGDDFLHNLSIEEKQIAQEFLTHARALRQCATPLAKLQLLKQWGGATIAYRQNLQQSPSYRLNHEELAKAFAEGINFIPEITPLAVEVDEFGSCMALKHQKGALPARTLLIAAGTKPNTVLAREFPELLAFDKVSGYFEFYNAEGDVIALEKSAKPKQTEIIIHNDAELAVSCFGDAHPSFAGNVVKAMASAKRGYPKVCALLDNKEPNAAFGKKEFLALLDKQLLATVKEVNRLTPDIVEVVLHAPLAAANFAPGQFYRLQNYKQNSALAMEGLALTGAWVDKEKGLLATIVLEMGGSSNLCASLKPKELVCLMGPTGEPTHIPRNEVVLLVGGGLGNAVLFSIGKALRQNGCRVLYFAGYKKAQDCYMQDALEAAADAVVWCCDQQLLPQRRPQDKAFQGNIVEAMLAYAQGALGDVEIAMEAVQRIIMIGSDKMMHAVQMARQQQLRQYLKAQHVAVASINSPMQCMLKEICGQCLQRHVNPATGEESYVYSCFNQDQLADFVDFECLHQRLQQNSLLEKVTAAWLSSHSI